MQLVNPRILVYKLHEFDAIKNLIEVNARRCYRSEGKITKGSAEKLIKKLIDRGHHPMIEFGMICVEFTCDRAITHELVRHRIATYAQQSTRFCDEGSEKKFGGVNFIDPFFFDRGDEENVKDIQLPHPIPITCISVGDVHPKMSIPWRFVSAAKGSKHSMTAWDVWMIACLWSEWAYNTLRHEFGAKPEQARAVLPNCLRTVIGAQFNIRQWRYVFTQHCHKDAHPQIRQIMIPLLKFFQKEMPELFNDIKYYDVYEGKKIPLPEVEVEEIFGDEDELVDANVTVEEIDHTEIELPDESVLTAHTEEEMQNVMGVPHEMDSESLSLCSKYGISVYRNKDTFENLDQPIFMRGFSSEEEAVRVAKVLDNNYPDTIVLVNKRDDETDSYKIEHPPIWYSPALRKEILDDFLKKVDEPNLSVVDKLKTGQAIQKKIDEIKITIPNLDYDAAVEARAKVEGLKEALRLVHEAAAKEYAKNFVKAGAEVFKDYVDKVDDPVDLVDVMTSDSLKEPVIGLSKEKMKELIDKPVTLNMDRDCGEIPEQPNSDGGAYSKEMQEKLDKHMKEEMKKPENVAKIKEAMESQKVGMSSKSSNPESINNEYVARGDGKTTKFHHKFANLPIPGTITLISKKIVEGQLNMKFVIMDEEGMVLGEDNGKGVIKSSKRYLKHGTVDYSAGTMDLEFKMIPGKDTAILIDYEYEKTPKPKAWVINYKDSYGYKIGWGNESGTYESIDQFIEHCKTTILETLPNLNDADIVTLRLQAENLVDPPDIVVIDEKEGAVIDTTFDKDRAHRLEDSDGNFFVTHPLKSKIVADPHGQPPKPNDILPVKALKLFDKVTADDLILDDNPTKETLERAEKEMKMIVVRVDGDAHAVIEKNNQLDKELGTSSRITLCQTPGAIEEGETIPVEDEVWVPLAAVGETSYVKPLNNRQIIPESVSVKFSKQHGINWVSDKDNGDGEIECEYTRIEINYKTGKVQLQIFNDKDCPDPNTPILISYEYTTAKIRPMTDEEFMEFYLHRCNNEGWIAPAGKKLDVSNIPCIDFDAMKEEQDNKEEGS